jgi:hypothetical protein
MPKHAELPSELQQQITAAIVSSRRLDEVILRGHLYVEYCLNELILARWSNKGIQIVERFTFDQKIAIADGTGIIDDAKVIKSLKGLNKLRNMIAHSLFPSGLKKETLSTELTIPESEQTEEDAGYRCKMIVIALCVSLAGRTGAKDGGVPEWLTNLPHEFPE